MSPATPEERLMLVVVVVDTTVQAVLMAVATQTIVKETSAVRAFSQEDEFVVATDECLQELGPDSEQVTETICFVTQDWMEKDTLNQVGKSFLQGLQRKLGLELVGFLNITEALSASIPYSATQTNQLALLISDNQIWLSTIAKSQLLKTSKIGRSDTLQADITQAIKSLGDEADVGKVIVVGSAVYGQSRMEQEGRQLDTTSLLALIPGEWYMLAKDTIIKMLVMQAGGAVTGIEPAKHMFSQSELLVGQDLTEGEKDSQDKEASTDANVTPVASAEFGDEDNAGVVSVVTDAAGGDDAEVLAGAEANNVATSFGVPIRSDFTQEVSSRIQQEETITRPLIPPKRNMPRLIVFIIIGLVLGIATVIGIGWFFLQRSAQVVVTVQLAEKLISQATEITIDPSRKESDPDNKILVAEVVSEVATGSATIDTTGIKIVGEKAVGEVTLYNKTTTNKTFGESTVLKTGNLEYILTETVEVPSATISASTGSETKKYGEKKVTVMATAIGTEHNLGKDIEFTIEAFDTETYSARSVTDIKGGTSREVRVVAPADIAKLRDAVKLDLTGKTTQQLEARSVNGLFVIPTGKLTAIAETFSAQEGAEVDALTVTMSLQAQGIAYRAQELNPLAEQIITTAVPEGYILSSKKPDVLSSPVNQEDPTKPYILEVNITAQAVPVVDAQELAKSVVGKPLNEVTGMLTTNEKIKDAQVSLRPSLARLVLRFIPQESSRVNVVIITEE